MPLFLHKTFTYMIAALGAMYLLLAGCMANMPVQEMSNARQSIQAAVDVGAEHYAHNLLVEARELLDEASEELESGNYPLARQRALEAKEHALKARQTAMAKTRDKP